MKSGFILYHTQYNPIKDLSLEQKGKLFDKIFLYNMGEEYDSNDLIIDMAFGFFKQQFEIDNKKYQETIVKRNQINGLKGGRPRKEEETQNKENNPVGLKKPDKDKDKDKDKDIIINNNKDINRKDIINNPVGLKKPKEDIESEINIDPDKFPLLSKSIPEFIEFRKSLKKPMKMASFKKWLEQLTEISNGNEETAVKILDYSMANGYQGIFPLKESNFNNNHSKVGQIDLSW